MEIDGFNSILSTLVLAKDLHDIGRFDIVECWFSNQLCYDYYWENIYSVTQNIFCGYDCVYDEDNGGELHIFEDDLISNYFVKAWDYGHTHKIPHKENPYVVKAHDEIGRWLNISYCVDWKLLAYTKTKRNACKSRLLISIDTNCGCNAPEGVASGLIQIYKFFDEAVNGVRRPDDAPLPGQLPLDDVKELIAA